MFLSAEDMACLAENKVISELHIGYGDLDDQGLELISNLTTLRYLNINYTAVTDAGIAHVARLGELSTLHAQHIPISDEGVAHLRGLTSLCSLHLRGTKTGDLSLDWISKLNLAKLAVGENTTDEGSLHLASVATLRELDLSRSAITGAGFGVFSHLTQLNILHLNYLHLCDEGFRYLQDVETLWLLSLFETPLSAAQLRLLGSLNQLKFLHLRGNGFQPLASNISLKSPK